jgi:hypothetical protein
VRVEVEGAGIAEAARRLSAQAGLLRQRRSACDQLTDGLVDPRLRAGAEVLSDLFCDVLELVAQDLDLLSTKVRSGLALYDETERTVGNGMAFRGRG